MTNTWKHIWLVGGTALLIMLGCADVDPNSLDPSETFVKYYGSTDEEDVVDMVLAPNGTDVLVLCWSTAVGQGKKDILLLSLDANGNSNWQSIIKSEDSEGDDTDNVEEIEDMPSGITLSSDSTTVWVISTADFEEQGEESVYIHRVNISDGSVADELNFRYYDDRFPDNDYNGDKDTRGVDLIEVNEGGDVSLVILGATRSLPSGPTNDLNTDPFSIFMTRIGTENWDMIPYVDSNGTLREFASIDERWSRVNGSNNFDDFGVELAHFEGQFYALTRKDTLSEISTSYGEFDIASGNALRPFETYTVENIDLNPRSIFVNSGFVYVTGSYDEDDDERPFFLFEIRSALNGSGVIKVIEKSVAEGETRMGSLTNNDDGSFGTDLVEMENGDFYVVGTIKNHTNDGNVLKQDEIALIRVGSQGDLFEDEAGNVLGLRVLGSDQDDNGRVVLRTSENNLLIGAQIGFGGDATMVSLMKLNDDAEFSN